MKIVAVLQDTDVGAHGDVDDRVHRNIRASLVGYTPERFFDQNYKKYSVNFFTQEDMSYRLECFLQSFLENMSE